MYTQILYKFKSVMQIQQTKMFYLKTKELYLINLLKKSVEYTK